MQNFKKKGIEILGYNINPDIIMEWKEKYYASEVVKKNTKQIYDKFLRILDSKAIIYNENDIRPQIDENELIERPIWEEIIKHEENKQIIGEQYWGKSVGPFGRSQLLNPNSEYYLGRAEFYPKAKEVVDIIHKAGGKAFLAHPFEYKFEDTIKFIDDLIKEVELDGIECFHPSANEENMKKLVDYVRKNNLYISGGSDYHGGLKPDIEIAVGKGNLNISKDFILEWINK